MAGPYACRSACQSFPSTGKDKVVGAAATEGSGILTPTSVVSHAPTPAPATAPVIAPSLDNKLFKQFMKAYLEAQMPSRTEIELKPCKQPLKGWFLDLYYGNLHINCYRFCQ